MRILLVKYLFVIFILLLSPRANATMLTSNFDFGLEGWTVDGKGSLGQPGPTVVGANLSHVTTGGNPDGFLQAEDADNGWMTLIAPEQFLGDLSSFNNGLISFDSKVIVPGITLLSQFGSIELFGEGSLYASLDITPGDPTDDWIYSSALLTASKWGMADNDEWANLLANVTGIRVIVESHSPVQETIGFDNFILKTPVPEPSTIFLIGSAMLGIIGCGLKKKT